MTVWLKCLTAIWQTGKKLNETKRKLEYGISLLPRTWMKKEIGTNTCK